MREADGHQAAERQQQAAPLPGLGALPSNGAASNKVKNAWVCITTDAMPAVMPSCRPRNRKPNCPSPCASRYRYLDAHRTPVVVWQATEPRAGVAGAEGQRIVQCHSQQHQAHVVEDSAKVSHRDDEADEAQKAEDAHGLVHALRGGAAAGTQDAQHKRQPDDHHDVTCHLQRVKRNAAAAAAPPWGACRPRTRS